MLRPLAEGVRRGDDIEGMVANEAAHDISVVVIVTVTIEAGTSLLIRHGALTDAPVCRACKSADRMRSKEKLRKSIFEIDDR